MADKRHRYANAQTVRQSTDWEQRADVSWR